jgi:hypothetical protein
MLSKSICSFSTSSQPPTRTEQIHSENHGHTIEISLEHHHTQVPGSFHGSGPSSVTRFAYMMRPRAQATEPATNATSRATAEPYRGSGSKQLSFVRSAWCFALNFKSDSDSHPGVTSHLTLTSTSRVLYAKGPMSTLSYTSWVTMFFEASIIMFAFRTFI